MLVALLKLFLHLSAPAPWTIVYQESGAEPFFSSQTLVTADSQLLTPTPAVISIKCGELYDCWLAITCSCQQTTGCPAKLFTLGYLLFCGLLLMQIAKVGTFLKNSGNLLHDRHKNFENRFKNSWDNWGQSWQPSFRTLHFGISQRQKNNFHVEGGNFDLNYLSYF